MPKITVTLNKELIRRGYVKSRSQADDVIHRNLVKVNKQVINRPDKLIEGNASIEILSNFQFVSRAGEKLFLALKSLNLNLKGKVVLDVGSSTGGFTEVSLLEGASRVIAVEKGTNQMHPALRQDSRVNLHEKTDILSLTALPKLDVIVIDVSFTSLRSILPHISKLTDKSSIIIALVKPQFESTSDKQHKGIVKNERIRRDTLKNFEQWAKTRFILEAKIDSQISGAKGNTERFYRLKKL